MSALDIEDRAAHWLVRREEPEWSADDEAELKVWLEQSASHKAAFWRLEFAWREADRIRSLGNKPEQRRGKWSIAGGWQRAAVAAATAAFLILTTVETVRTTSSHNRPPTRYDTRVGDRKTVPLGDGSTLELNTASLVRTEPREVWLDHGEAYFEVKHDPARPFVVHVGSRTITDLGTKFSVRRDADKVTISVLEGRVRVDDAEAGQRSSSVIMAAGDVAIMSGRSTLLTERSQGRVENDLAWRDGMVSFEQTRLDDAAAEFNRYNRKRIVIADPAVAGIRIGGSFQAENVDAFVRLLHEAYGLKVVEAADTVTISS